MGDTLRITNPDGSTTDVTVTQSMIDNGYTTAYPSPGEGSTVAVSAVVIDQAGNTSAASSDSAVVDTQAPNLSITSITDDTGTPSDFVTSDNTLVFSGTAEPGSSVEVKLDGDTIGTVTADQSGVWSLDYTSHTLRDGDYTLTAVATDSAGNSAAAQQSITVDTQAPALNDQTFSYSENQGADSIVATMPQNGDIVGYRFSNGTQISDDGYFTIDDSGNIRITQAGAAASANDYESAPNIHTYEIVGYDSAGNGSRATVTLSETDLNEAPTANPDIYNNIVEGSLFAGNLVSNDSDPENAALSVAQVASDSNGTGAQSVNGQISFTTALGGTVVVNQDGTFTYTAPVLDNSSSDTMQDFIYYRASDGTNESGWTKVTFNVQDTAPTAVSDHDSIGFGSIAEGNVITGAGGVNADILGKDETKLSAVIYNGVRYTPDSNGEIVVTTPNGKLTISEDGSYKYDSAYAAGSVRGTDQADWDKAGVGYYGFRSGSDPFGSSNQQLDLSQLDQNTKSNVNFDNAYGLGVWGATYRGAADDKVDANEYIVFDLGGKASDARVYISNFGDYEDLEWYAYNEVGELVGSGAKSGDGDDIVNISANRTPASGSSFIEYIVIDPSPNDEIRISGITYGVNDSFNNITDSFTYEITDADGDRSSADLTIKHDVDPVAGDDSATVYESGLQNGTEAGSGKDVATGNLFDNDVGISKAVSVSEINGTAPDGNGIITVYTPNGKLVVNSGTGEYTYTLTAPNSNGDGVTDNFTYTVTDAVDGKTSSATLTVNITDDAPVGNDIVQNITNSPSQTQTINLIIVLDRSGSMAWDLNGKALGDAGFNPEEVRMNIAKEALESMFATYDNLGNVNIKIVDFSSNVSESGWFVDDVASANGYLEAIVADGGTRYDQALDAVMNGYNPPPADKSIVYFISDGEPNSGYEVDQYQQAQWESFLDNNNITISYGIGITDSVGLGALEPIAYPNSDAQGNSEPYAMQVTDANELKDTLVNTIDNGIAHGDATLISGNGSSGIVLGADGGHIESVTVDGVVYGYDPNSPTQTISTALGGTLEIDYTTGKYIYTVDSKDSVTGEHENFIITAVDGDGDTKSVNLRINLEYTANIDANKDNIVTNAYVGDSVDIDYSALTNNDAGVSAGAGVNAVSADSGTDLTNIQNGVRVENVRSGDGFTYTLTDGSGSVSDTAHASVTLKNGDSLVGGRYDDILIAQRLNSSTNAAIVESSVKPGDTYGQDNQIGFKLHCERGDLYISSIEIDLRGGSDRDAYFNTAGSGSTPPTIGAGTTGIDAADVSFSVNDGSPILRIELSDGAFEEGDEFWFGVDVNRLGNNTGTDFGEKGVSATITLSDGSVIEGTYHTNPDGSSSFVAANGNSLVGLDGDDTLIGNDNSELVDGGRGIDTVHAGGGDDVIVFDRSDDLADGGEGFDILAVGENIDFGSLPDGKIKDIEKIDLENGKGQALTNLTLEDVIEMTDSDNTLVIDGDTTDIVNVPDAFDQPPVQESIGGKTYDVYTYDNGTDPTVILKIDQDISHT